MNSSINKLILCFLLVSFSITSCYSQKTEILWDSYGVPHVFAQNKQEMYFAYGWSQMHSHANLILKLYGQARGKASEYWGEEYLLSDQKMMLFNLPELAGKIYSAQEKEYKEYLDAFVMGINKYAETHPNAINEKAKKVLPVTVTDVLAHTIRVINLEFLASEDINQAYSAPEAGSNAIAIAPSRSASGNSMLVINPHLPWSDYYLWHEAHLNTEDFHIYGISLVGMPSITIGFNEFMGWAHTVNPMDGSDRYKLTLQDKGYLLDGKVIQFHTKKVKFKVSQTDGAFREIESEFNYSIHGPVVGQDDKFAYAVRIAGMENIRIFEQYDKMADAKSFKEFESAVSMLQNPMFNIIYADKDGNIFFLFNGNIPIRKDGDFNFWNGTIDGTNSKYIWDRYHPYEDLPGVLNPPSGFLQNCNDPPWTCTDPPILKASSYPSYFSSFGTPLRPQRAVNMLKDDTSISYEKLIEYKHNTEMEAALRFLDDLLAAVEEFPETLAVEAAGILKNWDLSTETDSKGAVLFARWWNKFHSPMIKILWDAKDPFNTPNGIKDPKKAVKLLVEASEEMKDLYGKLDVEWGEVYRYRLNDIDFPANGGPGGYGIFRTVYFMDDADNKKRAVAGETFVAVVEFADTVRARVLLSYGNSSQPDSPHRGDQLEMLSNKELREALLQKEDILKFLEEREVMPIISRQTK